MGFRGFEIWTVIEAMLLCVEDDADLETVTPSTIKVTLHMKGSMSVLVSADCLNPWTVLCLQSALQFTLKIEISHGTLRVHIPLENA